MCLGGAGGGPSWGEPCGPPSPWLCAPHPSTARQLLIPIVKERTLRPTKGQGTPRSPSGLAEATRSQAFWPVSEGSCLSNGFGGGELLGRDSHTHPRLGSPPPLAPTLQGQALFRGGGRGEAEDCGLPKGVACGIPATAQSRSSEQTHSRPEPPAWADGRGRRAWGLGAGEAAPTWGGGGNFHTPYQIVTVAIASVHKGPPVCLPLRGQPCRPQPRRGVGRAPTAHQAPGCVQGPTPHRLSATSSPASAL